MSAGRGPSVIDIVSWNVLADAYVRPEYFPSTPSALLAPGARTAAIVSRVVASGADVVCLQEVEPELVEAIRARDVYDVRYVQKGRGKPDGCAMLARRGTVCFDAVRELAYPDGSGHVALLAVVRPAELRAGGAIGIATSHVKWDAPGTPEPERWATRQLGALVAAMEGWLRETQTEEPPLAWVACGDFNVTPEDRVLDVFRGYRDVYANTPHARPTVNANGRPRRIDYIFADPRLGAEPRAVREIDAATPMPSDDEPSDHLAIGAVISVGSHA